jgi:hypothetical protein
MQHVYLEFLAPNEVVRSQRFPQSDYYQTTGQNKFSSFPQSCVSDQDLLIFILDMLTMFLQKLELIMPDSVNFKEDF